MITYTVHLALYLLQTKISRLKRLQNKDISFKIFVNLHYLLKIFTFYIKSKFMYVPFVCHNNERAIYYGSRIVH